VDCLETGRLGGGGDLVEGGLVGAFAIRAVADDRPVSGVGNVLDVCGETAMSSVILRNSTVRSCLENLDCVLIHSNN
jgi:hypothetical protein